MPFMIKHDLIDIDCQQYLTAKMNRTRGYKRFYKEEITQVPTANPSSQEPPEIGTTKKHQYQYHPS